MINQPGEASSDEVVFDNGSLFRILEGAEAITIEGVQDYGQITDSDFFLDSKRAFTCAVFDGGFELTKTDNPISDINDAVRGVAGLIISLSTTNSALKVFSRKEERNRR